MADWVLQIITERIPQKFGFDLVQDIQVIAPIYYRLAGVTVLNDHLQEKFNPPSNSKSERRLFGTVFRLGDKVMQTQNNYDKDVYNGDIGFIQSIDMIEQTLSGAPADLSMLTGELREMVEKIMGKDS